jgi:hypothetical protein
MTRRTAAGLYALIFLETVVWVALVPLAPTYPHELDLSKLETGAVLAAASFATLVVALPIGVVADRFGARSGPLASPGSPTLRAARRRALSGRPSPCPGSASPSARRSRGSSQTGSARRRRSTRAPRPGRRRS